MTHCVKKFSLSEVGKALAVLDTLRAMDKVISPKMKVNLGAGEYSIYYSIDNDVFDTDGESIQDTINVLSM